MYNYRLHNIELQLTGLGSEGNCEIIAYHTETNLVDNLGDYRA